MAVRITKYNDQYKQISQTAELYSDFNHFFKANPFTGDIGRKTDIESVKQSIRNILLTNKYERLRDPQLGTVLNHFLFENYNGSSTSSEIENEIKQTLKKYEPRANIIKVKVVNQEETNSIELSIKFSVINIEKEETLNLSLYRVR